MLGGGLALLCLACAALAALGALFPPADSRPTGSVAATTPLPAATGAPTPDRSEARVVDVVDGDTIRVQIEGESYTLRYIGIDTPEIVHPSRPVEWMGPEASAANEALVGGEVVYLEKDVSETDRYGRLLRYVFLPDGTFVNAELVRQGYALAGAYPPDVKYQDLLDRMEQEARQAGRGLWAATPSPAVVQPGATPPPPTQPPPVTQSPAGGQVVIVDIYANGAINPHEPDEYCEIRNEGNTPVNLDGWRLNAGAEEQDFYFPEFRLQPGQSCRVYTDEHHPETCGFSFGSEQALWNNGGDCGYLFNAVGEQVSQKCY